MKYNHKDMFSCNNMKRIIFILVLLLPALMLQASDVNGLFNKYKKFPGAQYVKKNKKELRALIDNDSSQEEKEMLRTAKEMRMLLFFPEEDEIEKLTEDLNALKGFNLALSFTHSDKEEDINITVDGNPATKSVKDSMKFIVDDIDPSMVVEIYGNDISNDVISKPLYFIRISEMTALVYIDGKMNVSDADKMISFSTNTEVKIDFESTSSDSSD